MWDIILKNRCPPDHLVMSKIMEKSLSKTFFILSRTIISARATIRAMRKGYELLHPCHLWRAMNRFIPVTCEGLWAASSMSPVKGYEPLHPCHLCRIKWELHWYLTYTKEWWGGFLTMMKWSGRYPLVGTSIFRLVTQTHTSNLEWRSC